LGRLSLLTLKGGKSHNLRYNHGYPEEIVQVEIQELSKMSHVLTPAEQEMSENVFLIKTIGQI